VTSVLGRSCTTTQSQTTAAMPFPEARVAEADATAEAEATVRGTSDGSHCGVDAMQASVVISSLAEDEEGQPDQARMIHGLKNEFTV
jgi:hypothetical protein